MISPLEQVVRTLADTYRKRYGLAVFEVTVEPMDGGFRARGSVLLKTQRDEVLERLGTSGIPVVDAIAVMSDPHSPPLAWSRPTHPVIDVRRQPDAAAELSTQALQNDPPARVLWRHAEWRLVQLFDHTLGWVQASDLDIAPDSVTDHWKDVRRAVAGATMSVEASVEQLLQAGRARLSQPYRLGGASEHGIDCSALVQRVFWDVCGLALPKHTKDQRSMGIRVSRAAAGPGDLLFFARRDESFGHVAISLESGGQVLLHSSLLAGSVCVEPFDVVVGTYAYLGARRVARFAAGDPCGTQESIARSATGSHLGFGARESSDSPRCDWGPAVLHARRAAIDLSKPDTLRAYNVHVLGLAGAEGAAIARFLVAHGVERVTAHDFSTAETFEKNFRLAHVGLRPRERAERLRELLDLPIRRLLRDRYLEGIDEAEVVFLPQGWFLYDSNAPVRALRERGDVVFSQMTDLYFRLAPCAVAAVTGTNGKSTTARLMSDILTAGEHPHLFAGNDRRNVQVLDRIETFSSQGVLLLEVSNRQLMDLKPRPHVAVITNVTPDHIEEHGSFEAYAAVKARLVAEQGEDDFAVLNADDPVSWTFREHTAARVLPFSLYPRDGDGAFLNAGTLVLRRDGITERLLAASELSMRGNHNVANTLAASMAAWLCGVEPTSIRDVLRKFRGIHLRMEEVATVNGVLYVNDVKATTPEAALAAVGSFDIGLHVIVGGGDKGLDYSRLAQALVKRARHLIVLDSPGGKRIADAVAQAGGVACLSMVADLEAAVFAASRKASAGEAVLLSPACPGLFSMYMDDACGFNTIVRSLKHRQ